MAIGRLCTVQARKNLLTKKKHMSTSSNPLSSFASSNLSQVRHGQDLGIRKQKSAVLVGYMAMSQTVGKVVFGRIADHPRVNRVYLYQMCLLVCSVLTTLLPMFTTFNALLAYCIVFGFHEGCFVVLIAVLTGDIAGRKMMATAFGVMYFFTGIPMMLGPPVAGK